MIGKTQEVLGQMMIKLLLIQKLQLLKTPKQTLIVMLKEVKTMLTDKKDQKDKLVIKININLLVIIKLGEKLETVHLT